MSVSMIRKFGTAAAEMRVHHGAEVAVEIMRARR